MGRGVCGGVGGHAGGLGVNPNYQLLELTPASLSWARTALSNLNAPIADLFFFVSLGATVPPDPYSLD